MAGRCYLAGRVPYPAVVVAVLAVAKLAATVGPRHTRLLIGPTTVLALLLIARRAGLTAAELGLDRRRLRQGAAYAGIAVAVVTVAYAVAVAVPPTRAAFLDARYQLPPRAALGTAMVIIPAATVVPEEIAFRGVLWGLLARAGGYARATVVSSLLFGLWHILPSLRLHRVNPAVAAVAGTGLPAAVGTVVAAVLFTGVAGVLLCELRRRSGSLLAPVGLHWAVNGLGVVVSALVGARAQ